MIKALAFDFDGLIVNSQPLHLAAWQEVLIQYGVAENIVPDDILGKTVEQFIVTLGLPKVLALKIVKAKQEAAIRLAKELIPPLYKTVAETLLELSRSYVLSIVSSAEGEFVRCILRHYRLLPLFSQVIVSDDGFSAKPDPAPYIGCAKGLNLPTQYIVAVEDSVLGVKSALKAGMRVIAITNTTQPTMLTDAGATIDILSDIKGVLQLWESL